MKVNRKKVSKPLVCTLARRTAIASLVVVGMYSSYADAQAAPARSSGGCESISRLREDMATLNSELAAAKVAKVVEEQEDFDAGGCVSDYGAKLGLGLPGLTSAFLDGLKDKACSALDDYIGSNLAQLGASISAPMDLGDVQVGLGKGDSSFDINQRDIGVDVDSVLNRIRSEAPEIDSGYRDFDRTGGRSIDDYEYLDRSRGQAIQTPDYNPSTGGRR